MELTTTHILIGLLVLFVLMCITGNYEHVENVSKQKTKKKSKNKKNKKSEKAKKVKKAKKAKKVKKADTDKENTNETNETNETTETTDKTETDKVDTDTNEDLDKDDNSFDNIVLGNKFSLSGIEADDFLSLMTADGKSKANGGFSANKLHADSQICLGQDETCISQDDLKKLAGFDASKQFDSSKVQEKMTFNKLTLGNKWTLSGTGDGHANDEWLRLMNKEGTDYSGGFAANKLWSGSDIYGQGKLCLGDVCVDKNQLKNATSGSANVIQNYDTNPEYKKCANHGQLCDPGYATDIYYGAKDKYAKLTARQIQCDHLTFGDPIFGVGKSCYVKK
jgi:hypothetical protein